MKLIKIILAPLTGRLISKYLPDILAYIISKGLGWLIANYPEKTAKVQEVALEIGEAVTATVNATADGKVTTDELIVLREKYEALFK